jgi:HJR/Mrr/RecB family endonuclease
VGEIIMFQNLPKLNCEGYAMYQKMKVQGKLILQKEAQTYQIALIQERGTIFRSINFEQFNDIKVYSKSNNTCHQILISLEHGEFLVYSTLENINFIIKEIDKLKKQEIKAKEDAINIINAKTIEFANCDVITRLTNGFIENNAKLFLNIDLLYQYEKALYSMYNQSYYKLSLENINSFITHNTAYQYQEFFSDYKKLVTLICKNNNDLSFDQWVFITWKIMKRLLIKYFAMKWKEESRQDYTNITDIQVLVGKFFNEDILEYGKEYQLLFTYFIADNLGFDKVDIYDLWDKMLKTFKEEMEKHELESFEKKLLRTFDKNTKTYSIADTDLMTGEEFEHFIVELFQKMGYKTELTKKTGDQGIDIIAEKNKIKYGIQVKCYTSTVSNSAIQEVAAGIKLYTCSKAIVITNNYFTKAAIELAQANNVILWDREFLKLKIEETLK